MKMQSIQERDLLVPLLIEVAIRGGSIEVFRGSHDIDEIETILGVLFRTNPKDWGKLKFGQERFHNWIQQVRRILVKDGFLTGYWRKDWRITRSGYDRLRTLVKSHLSILLERDKEAADKYLFDTVECCDFSRFSQALQLLEPADLRSVIHNASTPQEMFLSAIDLISEEQLAEFLLWSFEDLGRCPATKYH